MKLGWQVGQWPAKSETWIRLEVETLKAMGHEVKVSAFNHKRDLSQCDFVICHFANIAGFADIHRTPFLLVPHAYDIFPSNGKYLRLSVNRDKNLVAIGCISTYHRDKYLKWGIPKELLIDYPCAVDVDLFSRKDKPLGDLVVHGGRNVPKKGFPLAMKAWPDITLFGDHPLSVGWLAREKLRDLYLKAWCYMGSFVVDRKTGDQDGLPIALLEALAIGLRVVTTEVAGISDLKKVVTFANPTIEDLRDAVESEPMEVNEKGIEYVRKRHAPDIVARNILAAAERV